jgi:hypothetical protein
MKKITLTLFGFVLILTAHAQNYVSLGPTLSQGNKRFPIHAKTGIGLGLSGYLELHRSGGLRGSIAYDFFHQRSFKNSPDTLRTLGYHGSNLSFIPLKVGYQQFLFRKELFVFSSIGISFLQSKSMYLLTPRRLAYDFGAGYNIRLSRSRMLEVSSHYNFNHTGRYTVSDNYLTVRVGYVFK